MAEIKIEKKSGSLAWLWALIALVVIGLLLWLFLGNDRDERATNPVTNTAVAPVEQDAGDMTPADNTAMAATSTAAGPITDIATITGSNDNSLVGRDVRLSNVPVGDVPGDASFWINGADGKKVYVVLNEVATPNTPIEGRVDVDKGDNVDVVGTLQAASEGAPKGAAMGTKTDPLPAGITHFIYAQSAKVVR